jgi:hypothetical protein
MNDTLPDFFHFRLVKIAVCADLQSKGLPSTEVQPVRDQLFIAGARLLKRNNVTIM